MAKKFSELRSRMSPEAQAEAVAKAIRMMAEMPLDELRHAKGMSQQMLAEILSVKQTSVATIEKRSDGAVRPK